MAKSAAQIKAIGGRRFFKRNKKRIAVLFGASLLWVPVAVLFVSGNSVFNGYSGLVKLFIYAAAPLMVGVNIFLSYKQACALFYQKVRQHPELLEP